MNKTRILGGFSLVEMMLLLLVTSLMLASSVTLITRKHVKVPKIAMHGAYICYEKNGRLHEEQYVGSGLRRKTRDQDVAACSFKPPARTAYLHIQAIGGGGGGGDSGYTGGKIETFRSATEVISPFGITQGLLDLKGISAQELKNHGGTVYAYANASGDLGDAGRGGDLYYIAKDCKNTCLQWRDWEYKGTQEVDCSCKQKTDSYTVTHKNYDLWDTCYNTCYEDCNPYKCEPYNCKPYTCYDDCIRDVPVNCNYSDGPCSYCYETESGKGWPYNCKNNAGWKWGTEHYQCREHTCYETCYKQCYNRCPYNCNPHSCNETSGSCQSYTLPTSSFSDTYSNLNVYADDRYTEDWRNPNHMYETVAATGTATPKVRNVKRDKEIAKDICNYGNPDKFTGVSDGVFGTFATGEIPVGCDTGSIRNAFGEDIFPMGGGQTVFAQVVTSSSKEVYGTEIKYDTSEEEVNAYGQRCVNDAKDGTCNKFEYKNNVSGVYKSLVTGYNVSYGSSYSDNCPNPNSYDHGYLNNSSTSTSYTSNYGNGSAYCSCPRRNSSGAECVSSKTLCSYIPAKATGGNAGAGTKCRTADINAGLGLNYVGNSTVIPGIRGSDINCTGAGYKSLYTETEYNSQPSCYAQNGTDSLGSASVNITGNGSSGCIANNVTPLQSKGARKTSTNASLGANGANSIRNGTISYSGSGASNGGGCGAQHVGYCLKGRENGKYTYWYTWDTNYLQYGEGGKAGQYRAMIIRSFDGRELPITLGRGGAGGANATGNAGVDGGTTVVGNIVQAEGGAGGPGGKLTPTEQLPIYDAALVLEKGKNGTPGASANVANFKANILNLILPIDNSVLGQWLAASGAGGDGGGSRNNCWASEWERNFEGADVTGKTGPLKAGDVRCRKPEPYWSATPNATSGISGAVLIRW